MQQRLAALIVFLAFGLAGLTAQSLEKAFPEQDTFRIIAEPISVGIEAFSARLDGIRSEGREPLGLVLAGGSARAYAHIGVLKVLEDAGLRPDFIVANSMGAVIGMLYAAGISPDMIAGILDAVPLEYYLNPVLPTQGGIINADPLVAAVEELTGKLDLSGTQIPIIVTAEDLRTRRQVELAAGDFSRVMATTFAMPAIFEPVPFGEFLLVDGGATNLVPAAIASRYSSLLIVSTALYDKAMTFGNLLTVLNRSFDIGKTRAGVRELLEASPLVIRNRVEDVSYMQFASPGSIIERGRASALAVIDEIVRSLPPSAVRASLPPALVEARHRYEVSIPPLLAALGRGALPSVMPSTRFKLRYKLVDEFEPTAMDLGGQNYLGLAAALSSGRTRVALSSIVGLSGDAGRQWALTSGVLVNPADTFRLGAELRLWGDFSPWPEFFLKPASIEALGALSWTSKGESLLFRPTLDGSLSYALESGDIAWKARAGMDFEAGLHGKVRTSGPWKGFLTARPGAFADTLSGVLRYGPELAVRTGIAHSGKASLRGRLAGRFDASGSGLSVEPGDAYRGRDPSGTAPLAMVANLELVWLARALEFDAGEILLVKDMELGPYFDFAWLAADGAGPLPDGYALGLAFGTTVSFAGLSPFSLSLFAGFDSQGSPVLGLRSGRLFPLMR